MLLRPCYHGAMAAVKALTGGSEAVILKGHPLHIRNGFPPERRGTEPASLTGFHRLARYRPYDYQGGTQ